MDDEVRQPRSAGSMASFARLAPSLGPNFMRQGATVTPSTQGSPSGAWTTAEAGSSGIPSDSAPPIVEIRAPRKATAPFTATDNRKEEYDAKFRVVLVSSAAPEAAKVPSIVGSLCREGGIEMQVVATPASLRFYDQAAVDGAVRHAFAGVPISEDTGVKVWTDDDEWSSWGARDAVLHSELEQWADLVVVAPCSADMLAKVAAGFSDSLALSLLRAVKATTPVILCPSMSAAMHAQRLTAKHTAAAREFGFVLIGPQAGPPENTRGSMSDWRDVVIAIQDMAALFRMRQEQCAAEKRGDPRASDAQSGYTPEYLRNRARSCVVTLDGRDAGGAKVVDLSGDADADVPMDGGTGERTNQFPQFGAASLGGYKGKARDEPSESPAPKPPAPFEGFRPIWGEMQAVHDIWPVPGLATTRERRDGEMCPLGPKVNDLMGAAGAPMQFSSSSHWRIVTGEATETSSSNSQGDGGSKRWWT